jgi:hypothetical protein
VLLPLPLLQSADARFSSGAGVKQRATKAEQQHKQQQIADIKRVASQDQVIVLVHAGCYALC